MSSPTPSRPFAIQPKHVHAHTHTVILLLNTTKDRPLVWANSLRHSGLFDAFPTIRWVFPHSGRWPHARLDSIFSSPEEAQQALEEQNAHFFKAMPDIRSLVLEEVKLLEGNEQAVLMGGMGLGALTALRTLLNLTATEGFALGGFVGLTDKAPLIDQTLGLEVSAFLRGWNLDRRDFLCGMPVLLQRRTGVKSRRASEEMEQMLCDIGGVLTAKAYHRDSGQSNLLLDRLATKDLRQFLREALFDDYDIEMTDV